MGVSLAVVAVDRVLRRRRGLPPPAPDEELPWQLLALALGALGAFALARLIAYRLYLPYRVLTHVIPYVLYVATPLIAWSAARALLKDRRAFAVVVAIAIAAVPVVAARGTGLSENGRSYQSYQSDRKLWTFLRTLPHDATFACSRYYCDYIGVFSYRRAYATKNLAHPFRRGYYDETERRILENNKALYANTFEEVLAFAEREKVDYFVYSDNAFAAPDKRYFEPVRKKVKQIYAAQKSGGFALAKPPAEAVVWARKGVYVVDLKKLSAYTTKN
jgi:hypothetical protein